MNYPVVIVGAGSHSKVLVDALGLNKVEILGITDEDSRKYGQLLMHIPIIGNDEQIIKYQTDAIRLVNGIGSVRVNPRRSKVFECFKSKGYEFFGVTHPMAIIACDVVLSEGVQVMAGAVIQSGCIVGKNVIINTRAVVEHDCRIGDHVHIASGAILAGSVTVEEHVHIGAGATVIEGIHVGHNSLIAAGATVIRNVPDNATVAGVPAKVIKI